MRRTAALIVGGGPAGSAAAIMLARGGMAPELIERTPDVHDVVCGGFLGWDALASLERLGIDAKGLGARPIHRLRLVTTEQRVEVDLPHPAAGLSRRVLDAALLSEAASAGTVVMRGRAVRAGDPMARSVRLDDGEEIAADALLLATGKHELRGMTRTLDERAERPSLGLRTALPGSPRLHAELEGVIELHLFEGGYAGLLLQEDGTTNICLSVEQHRLSEARNVRTLIDQVTAETPRLGERLRTEALGEWDAVAGVPYGWRTGNTAPGVFRLGDQSAVIASLAGDGVAIALRSGTAAAAALLRHGPEGACSYQAAFSRRSALPLAVAEALRRAAARGGSRRALMRMATVPNLARLAARLTRIG